MGLTQNLKGLGKDFSPNVRVLQWLWGDLTPNLWILVLLGEI